MPNLGGRRKWCTSCKAIVVANRQLEYDKLASQGKDKYYWGYAFMILDNNMTSDWRDQAKIALHLTELGIPYHGPRPK